MWASSGGVVRRLSGLQFLFSDGHYRGPGIPWPTCANWMALGRMSGTRFQTQSTAQLWMAARRLYRVRPCAWCWQLAGSFLADTTPAPALAIGAALGFVLPARPKISACKRASGFLQPPGAAALVFGLSSARVLGGAGHGGRSLPAAGGTDHGR